MINYRKILALLCAMILSLSFTGSFAEGEEEIVIPYLIGMNVSAAIELLNTLGVQHTEITIPLKKIPCSCRIRMKTKSF